MLLFLIFHVLSHSQILVEFFQMGKKFRRDKCQIDMITGVLRLIKKKVPVMLVWQSKGEVQKIGTGNMCKWFENLGVDLKNDLRNCMVKDIVEMNNKTDGLIVNEEGLQEECRAKQLLMKQSKSVEDEIVAIKEMKNGRSTKVFKLREKIQGPKK